MIWQETFDGGSPEAEQAIFQDLARDILTIQQGNRQKAGAACPMRTLHAKAVTAIGNARLIVDADMPPHFVTGHIQPGAVIPASLRLSNASGIPQGDALPDMRGAAIRLHLGDGAIHDLLMTSFPVSHARDARQFVAFAMIAAGDRATMPARLVEAFGLEEAQRMGTNLAQGVRPCASLAQERFWSRGAVLWNDQPVRYDLRPAPETAPAGEVPDDLRAEMAARLGQGPVRYRLALQPFRDKTRTPIEDGAVEWREEDSPFREIATLELPMQDLLGEEALVRAAVVEAMAFNPWNAPDGFRPLGNLNRARGVIYGQSAKVWQG
jgi:hypothetical protein